MERTELLSRGQMRRQQRQLGRDRMKTRVAELEAALTGDATDQLTAPAGELPSPQKKAGSGAAGVCAGTTHASTGTLQNLRSGQARRAQRALAKQATEGKLAAAFRRVEVLEEQVRVLSAKAATARAQRRECLAMLEAAHVESVKTFLAGGGGADDDDDQEEWSTAAPPGSHNTTCCSEAGADGEIDIDRRLELIRPVLVAGAQGRTPTSLDLRRSRAALCKFDVTAADIALASSTRLNQILRGPRAKDALRCSIALAQEDAELRAALAGAEADG